MTGIKEEIEQDMINQSVHVDLKQRQTIANLRLMQTQQSNYIQIKQKL